MMQIARVMTSRIWFFLSRVNSLIVCGPQVDSLIYCKRSTLKLHLKCGCQGIREKYAARVDRSSLPIFIYSVGLLNSREALGCDRKWLHKNYFLDFRFLVSAFRLKPVPTTAPPDSPKETKSKFTVELPTRFVCFNVRKSLSAGVAQWSENRRFESCREVGFFPSYFFSDFPSWGWVPFIKALLEAHLYFWCAVVGVMSEAKRLK